MCFPNLRTHNKHKPLSDVNVCPKAFGVFRQSIVEKFCLAKIFCVMLSAVFLRFLVVSRLRGRTQLKIVRLSCVKHGKTP